MGSFSGDDMSGERVALNTSIGDSDRALFLSTVAWGAQSVQADDATGSQSAGSGLFRRLQRRLAPARFEALKSAFADSGHPAGETEPRAATDELTRMHRAMAGVDLSRVHPSWLVRALQDESPAVQRLATSSLDKETRHRVQAGLLLDSRDLQSERPPASEVANWVMSLWTERLVGGEPERPDDPPALCALVRLPPRAGYRLCRMAGYCKLVLAGELPVRQSTPSVNERYNWLAGQLSEADDEMRAMAKRDVSAIQSTRIPTRHQPARIGLTTVARSLVEIEPFRLRWALQHWPYPVAKLIRSMLSSTSSSARHAEAESAILKIAWDRINQEGRLAPPWPGPLGPTIRRAGASEIASRAIGPPSSLFHAN